MSALQRKPIDGFDGYEVSSDGSVWSCWNSRWGKSNTWRRLAPRTSAEKSSRYYTVSLYKDKQAFSKYIHLLVLEAFVSPRPGNLEGCHGDGNSANNALTNLRWDTTVSNRADTIRQGRLARGEDFPQAKLTAQFVRQIRADYAAGAAVELIAKKYSYHKRNVYRVIRREIWRHIL